MSEYTRKEYVGPWLIDWKQLQDLEKLTDDLFEKIGSIGETSRQEKLNEYLEERYNVLAAVYSSELKNDVSRKTTEEEIAKKLEEYKVELENQFTPKSERWVELGIGRTQKIRAEKISALVEKNIGDEVPRSLELKISTTRRYSENASASMIFSPSGNLEIRTQAQNVEDAEILFLKVREWVIENKPNNIQQLWLKASRWPILIGLGWLWFSISNIAFTRTIDPLFEKAATLIDSGINQANSHQAIDLLMRKSFGVDGGKTVITHGYYVSLVITVLIVTIGYLPPKSAFGVGNGKRRVQWSRGYAKLVTISIPMLMLTSMLLPLLRDWLKSW